MKSSPIQIAAVFVLSFGCGGGKNAAYGDAAPVTEAGDAGPTCNGLPLPSNPVRAPVCAAPVTTTDCFSCEGQKLPECRAFCAATTCWSCGNNGWQLYAIDCVMDCPKPDAGVEAPSDATDSSSGIDTGIDTASAKPDSSGDDAQPGIEAGDAGTTCNSLPLPPGYAECPPISAVYYCATCEGLKSRPECRAYCSSTCWTCQNTRWSLWTFECPRNCVYDSGVTDAADTPAVVETGGADADSGREDTDPVGEAGDAPVD